MSSKELISLKELGSVINNSLPKILYNIKAEICQPKLSNGHLYFSMKDNTGIINSIIWKNNIIKNIKDGEIVEASGKLEYYTPRGSLSFIISDIKQCKIQDDTFYTKLKKEFELKGYFTNKLNIPYVIKNILVLSSKTGAAIHDFNYVIDNNKSTIKRTFMDIMVQGSECPRDIIKILSVDLYQYDMIVITRGGGSMEDLMGFNDRKMIETVNNRKIPILSAIGHMVDTTILDLVADVSTPTPSLAAQYIVDHNMKYIAGMNKKLDKNKLSVINCINSRIQKLNNMNIRINKQKYKEVSNLDKKLENIKNNIISIINNKIIYYDSIILKYNNINNNNITFLNKNNKVIDYNKYNKIVDMNQPFFITWNNIKIKVISYEKSMESII